MNEITRIHIAKVAYDIEVGAKKELEKYIKSLESYTQDGEVLADIEIRMTELLAERNVAAGGVISTEDVKSIRKQLGEPYEFADGDGDIAVGIDRKGDESRRLYRSLDDAVLGGVLSGISAYFKIDPLWLRLVFIVLLFVSFGTVLIVYLVLWIVIPPARTAAEKLQLAGIPVTLDSIRALNSDEEVSTKGATAKILQRTLSIGFGILAVIAALGTFAVTVWGAIAVVITNGALQLFGFSGDGTAWIAWTITTLLVVSGLLLTALFSLIAYMLLKLKVNKKLVIIGVVIILSGIITSSTALGVGLSQSWRLQNEAQQAVRTTTVNLPSSFASTVKELRVKSDNVSLGFGDYANIRVEYVVTEKAPYYTLTALPGVKPVISIEGGVATVSLSSTSELKQYKYASHQIAPELVIYGQALDTVNVEKGSAVYGGASQDRLKLVTNENAYIEVTGEYKTVEATAKKNSGIALKQSSIDTLVATVEVDARIDAGTIRVLTAVQPGVCPDNGSRYGSSSSVETRIAIRAVTSGMMNFNGVEQPAKTSETPCAILVIGDEGEYDNKRFNTFQ